MSLQMKRTSGVHVYRSSETERNSDISQGRSTSNTNKGHGKPLPVFKYIKSAVQKVAGAFAFFLTPQRNASGAVKDAIKSNTKVNRISYSTDTSIGSSSKTSSVFKSSSSYGSSSTKSGISGTASFSYQEICKATKNFSPENKIGEGSFSTVYKGQLGDGSLVAIKRARKSTYDQRLSQEFMNEVYTLSKIEHLNLVRLYGYLEHGDERIIVVEYVGNGTLREHLDDTKGRILEISERLDIAIDVAHAITYLHTYTDPPVIHRDIKASNILITEKFRAKVADFGFARFSSEDSDVTHISTQIKGTTGYLDPEYLRTYQLTEKSDVYSFGVLLVELITGRRPIEQKRPIKERVTIRWVMQNLKQGDAIFVMDPVIRRTAASTRTLEEILQLAHRCLASSRQSRPSMKECGEVLWRIRKELREKTLFTSSASTSHQSAHFPERDAKQNRYSTFGIKEAERHKFISA